MIGKHNVFFYTDEILIMGEKPIWVHKMMTVLVCMFESVGLQTNMGKIKVMVCNP